MAFQKNKQLLSTTENLQLTISHMTKIQGLFGGTAGSVYTELIGGEF